MGFEIKGKMLRNRRNHSGLSIADFAVGAQGPFYEENDAQAKIKDCVISVRNRRQTELEVTPFFIKCSIQKLYFSFKYCLSKCIAYSLKCFKISHNVGLSIFFFIFPSTAAEEEI